MSEGSGPSEPPPPDELPRSEVSDPDWRSSEHLPEPAESGRSLGWLLLAVLAVAVFLAALWILNPAANRIGKGGPAVVPAQPVAPKD